MQAIVTILTILVWLTVVVVTVLFFRDARRRELSDKPASNKNSRPEKQVNREPETST
jgi:hypothetical protein